MELTVKQSGKPPIAFTVRYELSLMRPRYGSTQPVLVPHGAEYGGYAGS